MESNTYKGKKIEFHILQSFPVTCLNRDDVGSPKTAVVGGVTRARVSSQAWKRQVRLSLRDFGVSIAVRTKHIQDVIAEGCTRLGAEQEKALEVGKYISDILSKDTLHFFSVTEAEALAGYAQLHEFDTSSMDAKEVLKEHNMALKGGFKHVDGLDIALFGRMAAQAPILNVEASASFSHAISTHRIANEIDFFTALDDYRSEENVETGSSHMGSLEFNSATYYRYISLDLGQLVQSLGDDTEIDTAVSAFIKALYVAVPSARQTTQSGSNLWDYARVYVRKGQRIQASFDEPVKAKGEGYLKPSIEALSSFLEKKEQLSGSLFGKIAEFTWGLDESFNIDELIAGVIEHIRN